MKRPAKGILLVNLHAGETVPPEARADLEHLAQYILRNPFSVQKMTLESSRDTVIYRSRLNARINPNFEVFTPTDFLEAISYQYQLLLPQRRHVHAYSLTGEFRARLEVSAITFDFHT